MKFQLVNFADLLYRSCGVEEGKLEEGLKKKSKRKNKDLLEALFQIKSCCFRRSSKNFQTWFQFLSESRKTEAFSFPRKRAKTLVS